MKRIVMLVAVVVMAVVLSGCCMFGGKCGCRGEGQKKGCCGTKSAKSCAPVEKAK
jgi:hypothetical protein